MRFKAVSGRLCMKFQRKVDLCCGMAVKMLKYSLFNMCKSKFSFGFLEEKIAVINIGAIRVYV